MSIVVFWMEGGTARHESFDDRQLLDALKLTEQLRAAGQRHVTISSELDHSVGKPGVAAVEDGKLPSGDTYDFNKRHRGAGPRSGS